jgi:hypothetical protein
MCKVGLKIQKYDGCLKPGIHAIEGSVSKTVFRGLFPLFLFDLKILA